MARDLSAGRQRDLPSDSLRTGAAAAPRQDCRPV